eukprot:CAMPEP_0197691822 /NCGR_PEP_ID=MMETSP1338-20131121/110252_1 /TAXON_ID=43686 ORGANISM="Pelagodinium beii, Strain RCC1491" /NCGR_SAMPLE_ID=MMETSP1338 /ASSEMBLY_ACC=CAM_ASM_000754 /LENGTH=54 /DNA_ID=CAMNT_0043274417 /DNA_START=15 /DNA_END=176 /DNA_ORIENTATION=+
MKKAKNEAAVKLQAIQRGKSARATVEDMKAEKKAEEEARALQKKQELDAMEKAR